MSRKILFISFIYPPNMAIGGRRIQKSADELRKLGHQVQVVSGYDYQHALGNESLPNVIHVEFFDIWLFFDKYFPGILSKIAKKVFGIHTRLWFWYWAAKKVCRNQMKNNGYDVVITTYSYAHNLRLGHYLKKIGRAAG